MHGKVRKGVEDFLILLAVAIVIVVVMLAVSSFVTVGPSQDEKGGVIAFEEFSLGVVGVSSDSVSKIIRLGDFIVGETQESLLKEVLDMDVSQGIAGGEQQEFTIQVSPALLEVKKGVKIMFSLGESAPLGNLKVNWNGKEFFNTIPSGSTEITIGEQYVKGENILRLEADGPGIQIWTSTMYNIRNFQVLLLTGPQKVVPFELLPSELQNLERGEVSFFGSGTGILDVRINGVSIFTSLPAGSEKAVFNMSGVPLAAGNNVLSFISSESNTISSAALRIFSLGKELVKTKNFDLNQQNLNSIGIDNGVVAFTVDDTIKSGILKIKLNGKQLDIQFVQKGENTVGFGRDDVQEGDNEIEFSGTGAWDIPIVKIGYKS